VGLEKTLKELSGYLQQLGNRVQELGLTINEDQPSKNGSAVVDTFEHAILDVQGWVGEAIRFARAAESAMGHPVDIDRAQRELEQCQDRFGQAEQMFSTNLFAYERLKELTAFAAEQRGEWPSWEISVRRRIDHCRPPLEDSRARLAGCWQEIAERAEGASVSVRTTTIGQNIVSDVQQEGEPVREASPFALTEFEGHVDATWSPRTYAVQSDLSGGITGAQASIYTRAKEALDQAHPLLDGLYPLDPEVAIEDIADLKAVVKSQSTELVNGLGAPGGPRVSRVNQYFGLLLGLQTFPLVVTGSVGTADPGKIAGTLGSLRDELGLNFTKQDLVNTVSEEEDLSNFRIVSDYVTSLAQSWLDNISFLGLNLRQPFFDTQLVSLSRQLSVIAESVDQVRFTLDSVFIGPAERQTLQLDFTAVSAGMFVEDLLAWIQSFSSEEGPRLIQDDGKPGVSSTFAPIAKQLATLVQQVLDVPSVTAGLPRGFHTARVRQAIQQLYGELSELAQLAR